MASRRIGSFVMAAARYSILGVLSGLPWCAAQSLPPPRESLAATTDSPDPQRPARDILNMDIEQLAQADVLVPAMDIAVSTVSRQASTVGRSPAAVFVITQEMIRRSGANNIPDLLRMAPGVEVARIDANKWAISIRGANSLYADTLLVQIDGRAVYTQFFSGVFWDNHDVLLEDIERIEVIRGPATTVWGASAVVVTWSLSTRPGEPLVRRSNQRCLPP
jgi:iron complex outermembrane receptor protein